MLDIVPLNKNVLIKPDEPPKVSKGGIIIPDNAKQMKPMRGDVVAIGPEVKGVAVGDTVYYTPYKYFDIDYKDVHYLVAEEEAIMVKLRGGAAVVESYEEAVRNHEEHAA